MKINRINALAKKELIQILRDPRSLALGIAIPIFLLVLFGSAITFDVDNISLAVWDQDKTQISSDFLLNFKSSKYFNIIGYYNSYKEMQRLFDKNQALMIMVIPKDFSKLLRANQPVAVQLLVDGSDSNTATIAMAYVDSIIASFNEKHLASVLSKLNLKAPANVDFRFRIWFNPDLKSRNFIVPGLIAVIMMIISALLTSLTFAREWERGTMEQLISTPVTSGELILGKFIPYFLLGFFDLLIAVAMSRFLYDVPLRGSLLLLFVLSSVFLTGAMCQGMLISIVTRNQLMASQLAIITTFLPAFLLSGFAYAISNMPKIIQLLTYLIPARYFIVIAKGIYLKGVGLRILWLDALFLAVFASVMVILANFKFKKKVS